MCSCHSILQCCVMFSGVKLSVRSFVLLLDRGHLRDSKAWFPLDRNAIVESYDSSMF